MTTMLTQGWLCPRCKQPYKTAEAAFACCGHGAISKWFEMVSIPYYATEPGEPEDFVIWCPN